MTLNTDGSVQKYSIALEVDEHFSEVGDYSLKLICLWREQWDELCFLLCNLESFTIVLMRVHAKCLKVGVELSILLVIILDLLWSKMRMLETQLCIICTYWLPSQKLF